MREKEFKRWLRQSGRYSTVTIRKTLRYVQFLEEKLQIDMDTVTIEELTDILADLEEAGTPVKRINNWIKYLNRYLEFRGSKIKIRYRSMWKSEDLFFYVPSDEEMKKILAVKWPRLDIHWRNRMMLELLFATGIRIGELVRLNWSDFSTDPDGTPVVHIYGKGAKERDVPVPTQVVLKLLHYKRYYRNKSDPQAVFTTPNGRLTYNYARNLCKEVGKKAGVPQFHAHAARHWRAIKWLKEDVNLETIRKFLGHSSLKTTQIYLKRLGMEFSFDEVKKKDKVFGKWDPLGPAYLKELKGDKNGA